MARQNFKDLQITYMGKTQSFKQWVHELGLNYMLVCNRYRYGHRKPEALFAAAGYLNSEADIGAVHLMPLVGRKLSNAIEQRAKAMGLTTQEMVKYLLAKSLAE